MCLDVIGNFITLVRFFLDEINNTAYIPAFDTDPFPFAGAIETRLSPEPDILLAVV